MLIRTLNKSPSTHGMEIIVATYGQILKSIPISISKQIFGGHEDPSTSHMGSAASKTTRAISRPGAKDAKRVTVTIPVTYGPDSTKSRDTVPIDTSRRQGRDEWGDTLNRMSAIISSSTWTETPASAVVADEEPETGNKSFEPPDDAHVAQRSVTTRNKLPSKRGENKGISGHGSSREAVPDGMLSQEGFLLLFRLHRQDAAKWDAQTLSERFQLSPTDVRNLLVYSRTYLGRQDPDGVFRGYYNPDRRNTIVRFERD